MVFTQTWRGKFICINPRGEDRLTLEAYVKTNGKVAKSRKQKELTSSSSFDNSKIYG